MIGWHFYFSKQILGTTITVTGRKTADGCFLHLLVIGHQYRKDVPGRMGTIVVYAPPLAMNVWPTKTAAADDAARIHCVIVFACEQDKIVLQILTVAQGSVIWSTVASVAKKMKRMTEQRFQIHRNKNDGRSS